MSAPQTYRILIPRTGKVHDCGGGGSLAIGVWADYRRAGLDPILFGPGIPVEIAAGESCLLTTGGIKPSSEQGGRGGCADGAAAVRTNAGTERQPPPKNQ